MLAEPDSRSVHLADGRVLAYCEYGDPLGKPVLFFHGVPGSRLAAHTLDAGARRSGIRLIAPDRPGMGRSDYLEGRTLTGWPADAAGLADALGIGPFGVVGVSGGMPYVLACVLALPGRLTAAAVASGMGRFDIPGALDGANERARMVYSRGQRSPRFASLWAQMLGRVVKTSPALVVDVQKRGFADVDKQAIMRPDVWKARLDDLREAYRQGSAGVRDDVLLHTGDWGLDLASISMPVLLWYGRLDRSHPVAMAEYYARAIPGSRLWLEDGAGSLGYLDCLDEIFGAMFAASPVVAETGPG